MRAEAAKLEGQARGLQGLLVDDGVGAGGEDRDVLGGCCGGGGEEGEEGGGEELHGCLVLRVREGEKKRLRMRGWGWWRSLA